MANGESVFVVDVPETNYLRVGRSLRKSSKFRSDHDAFVVLPQTSHILKLDRSGKFEGVHDSKLMSECGLTMCLSQPLRSVDHLLQDANDLNKWFHFESRVKSARSSLEIGCNPRLKLFNILNNNCIVLVGFVFLSWISF